MDHISIRKDATLGISTSLLLTDSMEDHIDTLEDSPLLINDSNRDSISDEFHCHNVIGNKQDAHACTKLIFASLLCFLFMATELVGGYIAGSLAIMTDAAHLFSDLIGFLISLLSIWVARKTPTKRMTFGFHRAEVLGALLSVQTVWLLSSVFSLLSINRLLKNDYEIKADTMIIVASLGVIVNLGMGAILHGLCHKNHSHGFQISHSHSDNINVRAAAAHVLGDLLQSIGVLIAAITIKCNPNAKMVDPICTILFSVLAVCATIKVTHDAILMLLEGTSKNVPELSVDLESIPGVKHVHSLHVWALAPGRDAVAVHLAVDQYCNRDLVIKKAATLIRNKLNVLSCTIQTEVYNPDLISSCKQCQSLPC